MERNFFSAWIMIGFSFLGGIGFAQEDFCYTRKGEKHPLTLSTEKISIQFKSGVGQQEIQDLLSSEPFLCEIRALGPFNTKGFFTLSLTGRTDVKSLLCRLRKRSEVSLVNPVVGWGFYPTFILAAFSRSLGLRGNANEDAPASHKNN